MRLEICTSEIIVLLPSVLKVQLWTGILMCLRCNRTNRVKVDQVVDMKGRSLAAFDLSRFETKRRLMLKE